jgi:hypothetical protein
MHGPIDFEGNKDYPSYLCYQFQEGTDIIKEERLLRLSNDMVNKYLALKVITPDQKGRYDLYFTIQTGWFSPTINSNRYPIAIKEKSLLATMTKIF